MAAIVNGTGRLHCGASVISKNLLLTAGHCLHPWVNLVNASAVFGVNDVSDTSSTRLQIQFDQEDITLHPEYEVSTHYRG